MIVNDGEGIDPPQAESGKSGAQQAWTTHMAGLRASYARHVAQDAAGRSSRIEELLDPTRTSQKTNPPNWDIANEIEILLVDLKTGPDLVVALDSAFMTAGKIGVPSVTVLAKRRETLKTDCELQALLAKLLRDTHNRYAERRSERLARRRVANRMSWLGFGLTGFVVAVFVLQAVPGLGLIFEGSRFADPVKFHFAATTYFGFLGAYLSRLIAFQTSGAALGFDELDNGYSWNFLLVRLLVGGLSAVVVYFLISGQLIGGGLFPTPEDVKLGGFGVLWSSFDVDGKSYEAPTPNFAKLIVWCFISGFSERFLPDQLGSLDAKSKA
jgi:hypothetical protein